ncbi:hypothetical protein MFIFM68171_02529 [Madurella fahalii]|uniref:RBR-type E3 ubiquitin transferase n=1 Tax=Madurella fahalii TaxID=1157608 RepID=A0ABQ0G3J2_9PEZI
MDNEVGTWSFDAWTESHECAVCIETKERTAFPDAPLTSTCKHRPSTCLDCVRSGIRCDLDTKLRSEVACPECESWLTPDVVQRYSDSESWRKYNEFSLRKALEADKNFVWCAGGCGNGQIHDGGHEQPIVKCSSCGSRTCFQHKVPWHTGLSCDDWDHLQISPSQNLAKTDLRIQSYLDLKASEETIKQISKPCPGCGRSIEKNGGW